LIGKKTMTNRSKYVLFTKFDDGDIEKQLDSNNAETNTQKHVRAMIMVGGNFYLINKKTGSIGTFFSFEKFPSDKKYENKEFYSAMISRDNPTLEVILNNFRNYILLK
jgi:hypothetical protein